jgi:hypothetical protein
VGIYQAFGRADARGGLPETQNGRQPRSGEAATDVGSNDSRSHKRSPVVSVSPSARTMPWPGQLWLSRPPFLLLAQVLSVELQSAPARVEYQLFDEEGYPLTDPVTEPLGPRWWADYRPLTPRFG